MKRYITIIILVVITATGCQSNALVDYQEALNNTAQAKSGIVTTDLSIDMEFDDEGLAEEERIYLSYFDTIEVSISNAFNKTKDEEKSIVNTYTNFGGMGFDTTVYQDGEKLYMRLPILNLYIKLDQLLDDEDESRYEMMYNDYEESFKALLEAWKKIIIEENVIKGEKTYVTMDEGQIKATIYNIALNEEQLNMLKDSLAIELFDKKLIESSIKNQALRTLNSEEIANEMKLLYEKIVVNNYKSRVFVDFDGRIIKEEGEISLEVKDANIKQPKKIDIVYDVNYEQLNEKVSLEYPEVDEDMWVDLSAIEALGKTLPMLNKD